MDDDEQEAIDQVRDWISRLKAFTSSLDDIEAETATEFVDRADDALRVIVNPTFASPARTPEILLVLKTLAAASRATAAVVDDWASTPDVRDRYTRESAQKLFKDALDDVLSNSERWLSEGLPSKEQIQQALQAVFAGVQQAGETITKTIAELEAQDVEADADPYGLMLGYPNPNVDAALVFEPLCSITEDEYMRYRDAHDRLRKMLDRELYRHISDENAVLCDVLMAILQDLQPNRISLMDEDAWDERIRKLRSALISFTTALQIHQDQTVNSATKLFGANTQQAKAVKELFNDLKKTSFDYQWLEELRDALLHGDINAFKFAMTARLHGEPEVKLDMDRAFMLEFTKGTRKKWVNRNWLQQRTTDPSVLDMINAIQPLMNELQDKLDKIIYPNVADDVATIKELVGRFNGRQGKYYLKTGPGGTRRNPLPPLHGLKPRVLHFAATYQDEVESGS